MLESDRSFIAITQDIELYANKIVESRAPNRCVKFVYDEFAIEYSREVIQEAYKAEESLKTIILGAKAFGVESQNALLKILEEPPRNISFVIIAQSKSALLPTIRSRLFIFNDLKQPIYEPFDFSLKPLELSHFFDFVTTYKDIHKLQTKELLERLLYQAVMIDKITLSATQLDSFDKAIRLANLNVKSINIFTMVLMNFLLEAKNAH